MPAAFLTLLACQLVGTLMQRLLALPVPGPVIGMFLLTGALLWRGRRGHPAVSPDLDRLARALIAMLGLLFVPAGVGVMAEWPILTANALPIGVALVGSTVLAILVTGGVMHLCMRGEGARRP
ncbi:LrgA family protein [Ameyamaea chiangmaiensis NBRC 103196]|uniref:CidA/LrgA family protein n=1 Tax=Ameyamaea chiangmaiensis TaxID=442969 RepID=A0A850P527_9PROT|nr:CidA/LrgA family protein [Ameyamaea chiangmaiensis]MBS4075969.1 CidA/LrgA family protein [Ameyamaea chiangmaiensis]NVN39745.1 CidA/LrgA family protein [Ameyamaea chiangmaiensis]GBQ61580.1 LrgA family protein [Ameyamaea chiangmaiensis NBRC 103196]